MKSERDVGGVWRDVWEGGDSVMMGEEASDG